MPGLILELQAAALDPKSRVVDLLRRALMISKKLDVSEMEDWISHELNGYELDDVAPKYRIVRGEVKAWNPYHGWQTINFENSQIKNHYSTRFVTQPISELDDLVAQKDMTFFRMDFSPETTAIIIDSIGLPLQPTLHISRSMLFGILDAVRNNILSWSLGLEKQGIIGKGMTFSIQEKAAANSATYQITNNIGSISNSQFQQNSGDSSQNMSPSFSNDVLIDIIKDLRDDSIRETLDDEINAEYSIDLQTLELQAASPAPKKTIIHEALLSIRTILEGAVGNIIASQIVSKITTVINSIP